MSNSPIFDQLQAEFIEKNKQGGLLIGPPVGEGFKRVKVVDEYFKVVLGYRSEMIEVEISEPVAPMIEETVDTVEETSSVTEANPVQVFPKLYVVKGAPELINLAKVKDEDSTIEVDPAFVPEETEMEKTISIPKFEHEEPQPPSIASDETQLIPVVPDVDEEPAQAPEKPADDKDHVVPIRKPKAVHKISHRKLGATGTLSWFINRAA